MKIFNHSFRFAGLLIAAFLMETIGHVRAQVTVVDSVSFD